MNKHPATSHTFAWFAAGALILQTATAAGGVQTVYGTVLGLGTPVVRNTARSIVVIQVSATYGSELATRDNKCLNTAEIHDNPTFWG